MSTSVYFLTFLKIVGQGVLGVGVRKTEKSKIAFDTDKFKIPGSNRLQRIPSNTIKHKSNCSIAIITRVV